MDMIKSLMKFYEGKSHEPQGGRMFRVYDRAAHYATIWGRSKAELTVWLTKKEVKFTKVEELI